MLPSFEWSTLSAIPKAAGMQLLLQFGNKPGALNFGGTRWTSDDHSPQRTGPLYRPVGRLVNRISAAADAWPEPEDPEQTGVRSDGHDGGSSAGVSQNEAFDLIRYIRIARHRGQRAVLSTVP